MRHRITFTCHSEPSRESEHLLLHRANTPEMKLMDLKGWQQTGLQPQQQSGNCEWESEEEPLERPRAISAAVHWGKPRRGLQREITEDQITGMLSSSLSLEHRLAYLGTVLPTVGSGLLASPLTEFPQMILGCVQLKIKLARTCIFQSFYDTGRRTLKWKKEKGRKEKEKIIKGVLTFENSKFSKVCSDQRSSRVAACGSLQRSEEQRNLSSLAHSCTGEGRSHQSSQGSHLPFQAHRHFSWKRSKSI